MGDIKKTGMSQGDLYTFMSNVTSQINTLQTNVTHLSNRLNDALLMLTGNSLASNSSLAVLSKSSITALQVQSVNQTLSVSSATSVYTVLKPSLSSMSSISLTSL
jgi:hypothetical protein